MLPYPISDEAVVDAFPQFNVRKEPLGRGGMKTAYLVEQDEQPLVLKIIRQPLDDPDADGLVSLPARLIREIEGMNAIDHPRIVRILDGPATVEIEGHLRGWYTEPFYSGGTLADRLGTAWSEQSVVDLATGLVEAVGVLAENGIVHRDIKPGNIVFDDQDQPVLLDLGIALFIDLTPLTDQFGASPRTPAYAAPEQFQIRSLVRIDFRTDLFLVGVVLFEALTAKHPFNLGDPVEYLNRLGSGQFDQVALDAVSPSNPLRDLLRRLLAPNRAHRFRRVEHVATAIERCR